MTNYKIDENNIVIAPVDKSQNKALDGWKHTNKNICVGMIDNLDDTFSNPVKTIDELKQIQIDKVKKDCTADNPVTLTVDLVKGTQSTVIFKGGDSSASAIKGGVEAERNNGNTTVKIWDINKKNWEVLIEEGLEVALLIANIYMKKQYHRNDLIAAINNATTKKQIEAIVWYEPTL